MPRNVRGRQRLNVLFGGCVAATKRPIPLYTDGDTRRERELFGVNA